MTVRASVIIPTYNRPDMLQRTLSGIGGQSLGANEFEVLVVDDGSNGPPTVSNRGDLPFRLSVLRQAHQGPTVARNLGASRSCGEVLVFVDDDISLAERSLEGITRFCSLDANVVVLGRLVAAEGAKKSVFARLVSANECRAESGQRSREVPFTECKTGLLGVRRDAFAALGGFQDPGGGWPNWDDVDFGYRASRQGFRFWQSDEVKGEHWDHALADLATACERWRRASRSAVHLIRKHPAIQSHLPMFDDKTPLSRHDPLALLLRKLARRAASQTAVLAGLERMTSLLESRYPASPLLPPLYRWIIGSHIFLGFQQGLYEHPSQ
jgi:glycosyltransferase involved in cell wall biosynthesis